MSSDNTNKSSNNGISLLETIRNNNGRVVLNSEDIIDRLFSELEAKNASVNQDLDLKIRMAIQKVKLQKYYVSKLEEYKKSKILTTPKITIPSESKHTKKSKKKKENNKEKEVIIAEKKEIKEEDKIERGAKCLNRLSSILTKLFYSSNSIDFIVEYFKKNRNKLDAVTEIWIRNSISGTDKLMYYRDRMGKAISNYRDIENRIVNVASGDIDDDTLIRLKTFRKDLMDYLKDRRKKQNQKIRQKEVKKKEKEKETEKEKEKEKGIVFDTLKKKEWILDWNCVMFKRGSVVIYSRSDLGFKFKPTEVNAPHSLESFNYLKNYLNERLPPVRCYIVGEKLTVVDKINFSNAIQQFQNAARQGVIKAGGASSTIKNSPLPMSFSQALSKAKSMTPAEFRKYKSKYIDFLVDIQSKKYKIIPCVERMAHSYSDTTEYSFMFSIECKSKSVLIVHENVNPDRSTLLFLVKVEDYNKTIREIYEFLQSPEINKRSSLRERALIVKSEAIQQYRSINHDEIDSWKGWITYYKNYK